jgi:fluoride exporter
MKNTLLVALGGALGSVLRFWLGGWVATKAGAPLWGTLFVNIAGSFVIGALDGLMSGSPIIRLFLMVGLMGGFTTFSAFSLQTLALLHDGNVGLAIVNVAISIVACLIAVWLGFLAGRAIS